MQKAKQLIDTVPALHLAAVSDTHGNVEDSHGKGEPEVLCAVASLSLRHLDELSELLGLGPLEGWCVGTERASMFVVNRGSRLVAASGESGRNVETTLKTVMQIVEGA